MLTLQLKHAEAALHEASATLNAMFAWRSDTPPVDTWVLRKGSKTLVFITRYREDWLCYTEAGDACPMTWYSYYKWCPIWRPEEE